MDKKRKLGCLPSTSKAGAIDPGHKNAAVSSNEGPDDATLNPTTGSGNGDQVEPPTDADLKGLHPLLMPEILAHVFKWCPSEDLPSCRLVSKAWAEESLKLWRSSATLQFHYSREDNIFLTSGHGAAEDNNRRSTTTTPLASFFKFWREKCSVKPFHCFHLSKWEFALMRNNEITIGRLTKRFWTLIGSHITSLKLSDCVFTGAPVLRKLIYQACPNLQELTLDGCGFIFIPGNASVRANEVAYQGPVHGEQANLKSLSVYFKKLEGRRRHISHDLPISSLEILSHFPALKSLTVCFELGDEYDSYAWLIEQILNAIRLIRAHDATQLPLQQFRIELDSELKYTDAVHSENSNQMMFRLIQELNLPLELDFLRVNICKDEVGDATAVISASKATLRRLEIYEEYEHYHFGIANVYMDIWGFDLEFELPNLEALAMAHNVCESMQFLKYTPNLEQLYIYGRQSVNARRVLETDTHLISETIPEELAGVKLLGLKEFFFEFEVTDDELRSLIGWLPNVENLTMYLNDDQFAIVCEHWRSLEHLHVLGGKLTDKGITGQNNEGILPNITFLQGLKCFKIQYEKSELTDDSAFEGFLKLPDLQILDITSKKNDFGDEAYKALRFKIPISSPCEGRPLTSYFPSCPHEPSIHCDFLY